VDRLVQIGLESIQYARTAGKFLIKFLAVRRVNQISIPAPKFAYLFS
jgi:hypothetical protein